MKWQTYLSIIVLSSLLITNGCSDINSGNQGKDIRIEYLKEKSQSYVDEEALQKAIENFQTHPEIIDQINKNREYPVTRKGLIKEYQHKIERLRKIKQSKEYQQQIEKLKKMKQGKGNIDDIKRFRPYREKGYCDAYSLVTGPGITTTENNFQRVAVLTASTNCKTAVLNINHFLSYEIRKDGRNIGNGKFRRPSLKFFPSYFLSVDYVNISYPEEVHVFLRTTHQVSSFFSYKSHAGNYI